MAVWRLTTTEGNQVEKHNWMKLGSNTYRQMQSFFLDKSNSSEKVTRYVTNSFPMGISEDGYVR